MESAASSGGKSEEVKITEELETTAAEEQLGEVYRFSYKFVTDCCGESPILL